MLLLKKKVFCPDVSINLKIISIRALEVVLDEGRITGITGIGRLVDEWQRSSKD
jgi:hypothetical protein